MPEDRSKLNPQFKADAVQLVLRPASDRAGACDLRVNDETLGNWLTRGAMPTSTRGRAPQVVDQAACAAPRWSARASSGVR